jgi:DUF1680 family protein
LTAAKKLGDALLENPPDAAQIEPLVFLYEYTADTRYVEASKSAADAWLRSNHSGSLSVPQGMIELYRITGDEVYYRAAAGAWASLRQNGLSLTGAPSIRSEKDAAGQTESSCLTLSWLQLTLNLLRATGEAQYAEELERTIYNQLFATQDGRTGRIYCAPTLNGTKLPSPKLDQCVLSEARAIALIPGAVWGRFSTGVAVNLYAAGRATFQLARRRGTVQIYSEAAYPGSGNILLHVEPGHNLQFPLRLRVPAWTRSFTADVGGSHLIGRPGEFLTINREWKRGDTVSIAMDMTVRTINNGPDHQKWVAIARGPQVLALSRILTPAASHVDDAAVFVGASGPRLKPVSDELPANWFGDQAYSVEGELDGKPHKLVFVPFADARDYRVWVTGRASSSGASPPS